MPGSFNDAFSTLTVTRMENEPPALPSALNLLRGILLLRLHTIQEPDS